MHPKEIIQTQIEYNNKKRTTKELYVRTGGLVS
jgi:hypothetical protein